MGNPDTFLEDARSSKKRSDVIKTASDVLLNACDVLLQTTKEYNDACENWKKAITEIYFLRLEVVKRVQQEYDEGNMDIEEYVKYQKLLQEECGIELDASSSFSKKIDTLKQRNLNFLL